MQKKDAYAFLLRAAIPEVVEPWEIPHDEDLVGYFPTVDSPGNHEKELKSNLIWDAIWSAQNVITRHTRTSLLFWDIAHDGKMIEPKSSGETIPGMARELFALIMESDRPLNSQDLIFELYEVFPEPEKPVRYMTRFGIIQLLVNWTLKNLLILKAFGCVDLEHIEIDEAGCDCPLDFVTCRAMGGEPNGWMYITPEEYGETQRALRKSFFLDSGVAYDFLVRFPEIILCEETASGESKDPHVGKGED